MKYFYFLSRTEVFCVNVLWFIFILIQGTLVQTDIGIYSAIELFFAAKIIWFFGVIPMPGGSLSLFLLFLNLVIKLFSDSYTSSKIGTILIHIGILFFLFAAFFSTKLSNEGVMLVKEGDRVNFLISDSSYSLLFTNGIDTFSIPIINNNSIINKKTMRINALGKIFDLDVKRFYKNCDLDIVNDKKIFYKIKNRHTFPETEHDKAGVLILIDSNTYNVIEDIKLPHSSFDNIEVKLIKSRVYLPFHISLLHFEKNVYLKTNMAKSYKSSILIDHRIMDMQYKFDIQMNKPFRFNGYTFYQTSFIDENKIITSVFTVVNNPGNFIFYLGAFIVFCGLLCHILKFLKVIYYE